jgi:hypothetical protein
MGLNHWLHWRNADGTDGLFAVKGRTQLSTFSPAYKPYERGRGGLAYAFLMT